MENDFHRSSGDPGYCAIYLYRRRSGDAPVELAAAAAFRLASDCILASGWALGPMPHPLRFAWMARSRPLQLPPPHVRTLGTDDTRGAREISPRHARTLRTLPRARGTEAVSIGPATALENHGDERELMQAMNGGR